MFKLTKEEIEWIIKQIEDTIENVRIDDDSGNLTFDKKNFEEEDYQDDNIEMIGKLIVKLRGIEV